METTTRRDFVATGAMGFAGLTLGALAPENASAQDPAPPKVGPSIRNRERLAQTVISAAYDELGPQVDVVYEDPMFKEAYQALEVERFSKAFSSFTESITAYNTFHRRERRLWSLKIGKGALPPKLEQEFIEAIPDARKNYLDAFAAMDNIAVMLSKCGLHKVLEKHLAPFTRNFGNEKHPFTQMVLGYFRQIGCSQEMIDEFVGAFSIIHFDFLSAVPDGFAGLRQFTAEGTKAQVSILDYTEKNGFRYLRGKCGPPEWAVVVSRILASAGISIGAWVIVAIVVALLALLVIICVASPRGSWVRRQCEKLEGMLGIFSF